MSNLTTDELTAIITSEAASKGSALKGDASFIWILISGALVFFMHAGFAMLETGSVQGKNKVNILFKNIGTVTIGGVCYFIAGFAFAYGSSGNAFIGTTGFFGDGLFVETSASDTALLHNTFFFQFAFCVTAATIVSGAVAGRVKLEGYFFLAAYMTTFVYPVISHWGWGSDGWISAFGGNQVLPDETCGVIDYAGSGVVHMTGGVSAFIAAAVLGPRVGRFGADAKELPGHNLAMVTLGTFILWFGWYGFNCGSTLAFDGTNAAKVAVTTSLAPAAAGLTSIAIQKFRTGKYDLVSALNSVLGGLVSITAGCSTVTDWSSILIGAFGAVVYLGSAKLLEILKIDDPIGAAPVHGFCGIWGVIAVGIFGNTDDVVTAYSCELDANAALGGAQFGVQVLFVLAIIGWCVLTVLPFVFALKFLGLYRVSEEDELLGLDESEHFDSSMEKAGVLDAKGSPLNMEDEI